jgi:sulfofructosephosphate aldolase
VTLDALARESGTLLMVAMDQRESLRTMLARQHPAPIGDDRLVRFKLAVARELAPYASGFLIDRLYGFDEVVRQRLVPPSCGLVLAADALEQSADGVVEGTELDADVDAAGAAAAGAVALKLFVIWREDGERGRRLEMSHRFVELARAHAAADVRVRATITPPWFGRPGGGIRFTLQQPETGLRDLVVSGRLQRIQITEPA